MSIATLTEVIVLVLATESYNRMETPVNKILHSINYVLHFHRFEQINDKIQCSSYSQS